MGDVADRPEGGQEEARRLLLERAEELTASGSWLWRAGTDEILWSANLFRLLGVEPGQVEPSREYVLDHMHPEDRAGYERELELAATTGCLGPFDGRFVRPDGTIRHLRVSGRADAGPGGDPALLIGAVQDMTEQVLADREIAAYVAVSEALTAPDGFGPAGERLLGRLATALGFSQAALWLVDGEQLVRRTAWTADGEPVAEELRGGATVPLGRGIVGCAAGERRTIALRSLPAQRWSADSHAVARAGFRGGLAIPALTREEVVAVIELRSTEPEHLPERLTRSLVGLSYQLGAALARRRGGLGPPLLTAREVEVLRLAATGRSGPAIAQHLVLSPATVKTHLEHIYAKLGVPDRASAVARAIREGIIT